MPFANDIKLEEALLQLIGAWNGDRDEFRTILNNAIDIHVDPDWLVAKLAIHVGEKPPVIQSWRKGSYWPGPTTQKNLIELIKQLIIT